MNATEKPYVQIGINSVDTVIQDLEGIYDPDRHDRYETFESARDAALTSIEVMLDEADYDGDDHRDELERMRDLLENTACFSELEAQSGYQWFVRNLDAGRTIAA